MRRVPAIPTIVVLAAVATMIALGFWQLDRRDEKEALIATAERNLAMSSEVRYPRGEQDMEAVLYRRTSLSCTGVADVTTVAARDARGRSGLAQRATCVLAGGETATVDLGFTRDPSLTAWDGGTVRGTIAPGGRVVAAEPVAGLDPLATPDPRDLPNNHLAYAGQWFFFALTALGIYALVLRKRWRET